MDLFYKPNWMPDNGELLHLFLIPVHDPKEITNPDQLRPYLEDDLLRLIQEADRPWDMIAEALPELYQTALGETDPKQLMWMLMSCDAMASKFQELKQVAMMDGNNYRIKSKSELQEIYQERNLNSILDSLQSM